MGTVLVTGGAGYVGSHVVRELVDRGESVLVVDDLSEGHRAALRGVRLIESDFGDPATLDRVLRTGDVEFVVHLAARCQVAASMLDPSGYYDANVARTLCLLDAAVEHGVRGIVFSSSAAVYGEPASAPIDEDHPKQPTNPYGDTKLAIERALAWYHRAYGLPYVSLRFFNAAGAHPDGETGEDHARETRLIPLLLLAVLGRSGTVPILGDDYPTPDGTCVRDYVHVVDLARAHVLAMRALRSGSLCAGEFNLGNGEGFSVRQVVGAVEAVTGGRPPVRLASRRPGDPASLVASSARAREALGWAPEIPDLARIVGTAWDWHRRHPDGYGDR